jgi:hypothetical protein
MMYEEKYRGLMDMLQRWIAFQFLCLKKPWKAFPAVVLSRSLRSLPFLYPLCFTFIVKSGKNAISALLYKEKAEIVLLPLFRKSTESQSLGERGEAPWMENQLEMLSGDLLFYISIQLTASSLRARSW